VRYITCKCKYCTRYTFTFAHTCTCGKCKHCTRYTFTCACAHTCTCAYTYTCTYAYSLHIHISTHTYIHINICTYTYILMYIYIYIIYISYSCMNVRYIRHIYIRTYIQMDRQAQARHTLWRANGRSLPPSLPPSLPLAICSQIWCVLGGRDINDFDTVT
jgi:hypothetical protein